MSWPWETRTSTCRNFATISSGLYRFLAIAVLLDVETYLKSDHFVGGGSLLLSFFLPLRPLWEAQQGDSSSARANSLLRICQETSQRAPLSSCRLRLFGL